jgi:hypothetical protein
MMSAPSTHVLFELRGNSFKHLAPVQATFVFGSGRLERIAAGFKRTPLGDEPASCRYKLSCVSSIPERSEP